MSDDDADKAFIKQHLEMTKYIATRLGYREKIKYIMYQIKIMALIQ